MTLTPKQLQEHNAGLGGSDSPRYVKLDLDLWREKIGDAPPRNTDERAAWGSRLEPAVRDWLANELGADIVKPTEVARHPELPWLIGHLDGVIEEGTRFAGRPEGVEIKCVDRAFAHEWGDEGSDQVPIRHVLQCHHYMLCTPIQRFHLGLLLGGNIGRHYVIDYDEELAQMLLARAKAFWHHVETRTAPTPITLDQVNYLYPTSKEAIVKASETMLDAVSVLTALRRDEHRAARAADEVEVQIKAFMGSSAILADARGHKLCSWRQQDREAFDYQSFARDHADLAAQYRKTSSFRVFRLK